MQKIKSELEPNERLDIRTGNISKLDAIKKLEITTKDIVNTMIAGSYNSTFKGHGLEFEGYRDYTPGDDSSLIDWKATKRANRLLIKEFLAERNLNLFFLVDTSSTMVYSSINKLKNEYAAEFITSMAYVMLNVGNSVGFALFNEGVTKKYSPRRTKNQFYTLLDVLTDTSFYGGGYDLASALKFTMGFLEKGALIILVSDFIGLKEGWQKYLKVVGAKFDVIGVMIRDPADIALPKENHQVILSDPLSRKQLLVTPDSVRNRYKEYVRSQEQLLMKTFLKSNCDLIKLTTDKPFVEEILKFFRKRAKRSG